MGAKLCQTNISWEKIVFINCPFRSVGHWPCKPRHSNQINDFLGTVEAVGPNTAESLNNFETCSFFMSFFNIVVKMLKTGTALVHYYNILTDLCFSSRGQLRLKAFLCNIF